MILKQTHSHDIIEILFGRGGREKERERESATVYTFLSVSSFEQQTFQGRDEND